MQKFFIIISFYILTGIISISLQISFILKYPPYVYNKGFLNDFYLG